MSGMTSYLEELRSTLQDRLTAAFGVAVPVRMTKDAVYGNFTATIRTQPAVTTKLAAHTATTTAAAATAVPAEATTVAPAETTTAAHTEDVTAALAVCRNAIAELPVARVEFATPVFFNFYLKDGWQQEALRQILQNAQAFAISRQPSPQQSPQQSSPQSSPQPSPQQSRPQTSQSSPQPSPQLSSTPPQTAARFADFEVQYAYSRICNQLELLASLGYTMPPLEKIRFDLLTSDCEMRLMEQLAMTPDLPKIAERFHAFFNISQIRGEPLELAGARIALIHGCQQVFKSVGKP